MKIDEYLLLCLMFSIAFAVHSVAIAMAGDDQAAPVDLKAKSFTTQPKNDGIWANQGRRGLLNVRIQCNNSRFT
jgi:hypothetical protein